MLKLPNGTNSDGLAISSRFWPTACHATAYKMEVPTQNACKTLKKAKS